MRVMAGGALEIVLPPTWWGSAISTSCFIWLMASQARLSLGDVHRPRHPLRDSQLEILAGLLTHRGVRNVTVDADQTRLLCMDDCQFEAADRYDSSGRALYPTGG